MGPVMEMTMRGLLVDQYRRKQVLSEFKSKYYQVEKQLDRILKEGMDVDAINYKSNAQLINLFYKVMGIPPVKKRNNEGLYVPTVNREALEKIALYFMGEPIAARIMLLRDYQKKIEFLMNEIDPDGYMRTNFNIAGTNTGRLSSSLSDFGTGGNLQNVDRDLRSVFITPRGRKFANLDLEQSDSRNVGAICWEAFVHARGEKYAGSYLDACESGDLHTQVARMVWPGLAWGDDPSKWKAIADDKLQPFYRTFTRRDICKRLGHGTNFLGQPPHMAAILRIVVSVVEEFQQLYFAGFPVLTDWHAYIRNELRESNTLTTLWGRRRQFHGRPEDAKVIREATAYAPQSMTAENINKGLVNIFNNRMPKGWENAVWIHLQVHDSLLISYPEEMEDEVVPWALEQIRCKLVLAKGREFVVPTEAKVGWNWGDMIVDDKTGKIENPNGLIKYKGHDKRTREDDVRLDLRKLL